jgi:NADH:ubiquinone oxidoreductase subunit 3 (subunit A)
VPMKKELITGYISVYLFLIFCNVSVLFPFLWWRDTSTTPKAAFTAALGYYFFLKTEIRDRANTNKIFINIL